MKLDSLYNRTDFIKFVKNEFLTEFEYDEREVQLSEGSLFKHVTQLGFSKAMNISVLEIFCNESDRNKRIAITQNAFRILRNHGISNALIAFHYETEQWRLSLLTSKLKIKDGKIVKIESNPRRYSYLLGKGAKVHTPYKYLVEKGRVENLEALTQRFSVEIVNKQFYESIATLFTALVGGERFGKTYPGILSIHGLPRDENKVKYQEFAVRLIGRIIFCWFLKEKKSRFGIPLIPTNILSLEAIQNYQDYYHTILEPLFFELLNKRWKKRRTEHQAKPYNLIPYLNGGLFEAQTSDYYKYSSATESGSFGIISIPDDWFILLFDLLEQYNFTVDENTSYDVELSIDPEMLGRIFENLLAEINPETGESAKKATGSFYTPREIVDYMVDESLFEFIKNKTPIEENKIRAVISYGKEDDEQYSLTAGEKRIIVDTLAELKILDPACGSGAFPIGLLQKVVYILQQVDENAEFWFKKQISGIASTELRHDIEEKYRNGNFDYLRKLGVIRESIFGVDIQTIATEIAKIRCFLSLIIEEDVDDHSENRGIQPLPNLDFKFISANSLLSLTSLDEREQVKGQIGLEDYYHINELKRIRNEYFNADPETRKELKEEFIKIQNAMFSKTIDVYKGQSSEQYKKLSRWKPFENEATDWFDPEWMFGESRFDIVIANPPYIHLEHTKEISKLYRSLNFKTYEARGDIYTLFYEKGVSLLKQNGILCYITSNKWMRAAYGQSLRQFFFERTNPLQIIDFSGQQIFNATVDTNIMLLSKTKNSFSTNAVIVEDKIGLKNLSLYIKKNAHSTAFNTDASWIILSPLEYGVKEKIKAAGSPLKEWKLKFNFGIKTGCNEAFIISKAKRDELIASDPKSIEVICPILRGRDIQRYSYEFADQYIIALFPSKNYNIDDYPAIRDYLLFDEWNPDIPKNCNKKILEQSGNRFIIDNVEYKSRKKTNNRWYETQDEIGFCENFHKPKIIWKRIGSILRFAYDDRGCFSLDSTCIAVGSNMKFLAAYLNSAVGNFLLRDSPKTGTGDLLISVQAMEPILAPNDAVQISIPIVNKIIEKAQKGEDFAADEKEFDELLFDFFDFSEEERKYIINITKTLRR
ncbi:MAG: Eco57I restriction-modification methylase domain-containing protein [Bacillota bacterium]|nr:Eco57I restriction-modification methylase domain-containing protein [Bacillota bacterium]